MNRKGIAMKSKLIAFLCAFIFCGCNTHERKERDELRKALNSELNSGHILAAMHNPLNRNKIITAAALKELKEVSYNWKWVEIEGSTVAIAKYESKKDISKTFEKNRMSIENIQIRENPITMLMQGSPTEMAISSFNEYCHSKIVTSRKAKSTIFIITKPHISTREACIIILNALAINGLPLTYNPATNSWHN